MPPSDYSPDRPWVQQPCDTPAGYAWFMDYLMLPPPRDWRVLLRRPGCPWKDDPARFHEEVQDAMWEARAQAWDQFINHERIRTTLEVVRTDTAALAKAQLDAATELRTMGHEEIRRLRKRAAMTPDHPGTIRPELAARMVVHGIQTERLIMGQSTEIQGAPGEDVALEALSLEDLRTYRELQAKLEEARARKAG